MRLGEREWGRASLAGADALVLSRRGQLKASMAIFLTYALLGEASARVPRRRLAARTWVERQDEIARALAAGRISPRQWMSDVERLAAEVDLGELLAHIGRSQIRSGGPPSHNDPGKRYVRFLDDRGEPRRLAYGAAFFDFLPRNVVTPHGHKHMVSAHMVTRGAFRVRNFDRLRDEGDAMVIRPTRDYVASAGAVSTMSSDKDNIHWFVPKDGPATTFDVIISDLTAGAPSYEIKAIDPIGGRRLSDGSIVAPIMEFAAAARRYTADV